MEVCMRKWIPLVLMVVSFVTTMAIVQSMTIMYKPTSEMNALGYLYMAITLAFSVGAGFCFAQIRMATRIEANAKLFLQRLTVVAPEAVRKVRQELAAALLKVHQENLLLQSGEKQISDDGLRDEEEGARICAQKREVCGRELAEFIAKRRDDFWGVTTLLVDWGIIDGLPDSYKDCLPPKA